MLECDEPRRNAASVIEDERSSLVKNVMSS